MAIVDCHGFINGSEKGNEMKDIQITIEGVTPLLCNKFTDAAAMSATSGSRIATVGNRGTPKEQAEARLYIGLKGKPMIPQPNIFKCIIDGGKFHKEGKSKVTTQKNSMIPSCLEIMELEIPIETKESWGVDTRAVRIPSTGGRILCHRPIFNDWRLSFEMGLDDSIICESTLRNIIDDSGKRIGLGDFRPDCKGPFGKFVVVEWKNC